MGQAKEYKRYSVDNISQQVHDILRKKNLKVLKPKILSQAIREAFGMPQLRIIVVTRSN